MGLHFRSITYFSLTSAKLILRFKNPLLVSSHHKICVLRKKCSKKCSKFTGKHPCRSKISIKLQSNFIEITLKHGCSPVNLLLIYEHLFLRPPIEGSFYMLQIYWYMLGNFVSGNTSSSLLCSVKINLNILRLTLDWRTLRYTFHACISLDVLVCI